MTQAGKAAFVLFLSGVSCMMLGCSAKERLAVGGVTRTYVLHVPPSYSPTTPTPLVIALHQFSGSGLQMETLTGLSGLADQEGFIVAYPDGKFVHWNVGWDQGAVAEPGKINDVAFISSLIDDLAARFSIDPKRVYITGASNGGMMAQLLACKIPEKIAAIAPIYATLPRSISENCTGGIPVPVLVMHGTADPVLPWDGGDAGHGPPAMRRMLSAPETTQFWAKRNGCAGEPTSVQLPDIDPGDGTSVECRTYEGCTGALVAFYVIHGGGHTWCGSDRNWPKFIVGKTCRDIEASRTIWEFFKTCSRP